MRPLLHPAIEEVTVQAILHALSDPVRFAIYAGIVGQDCPSNCSSFVNVGNETIPKSTLSLHFRILREAGLIYSERQGVEVHNTSRCAEVEARFPRLLSGIVKAYEIQETDRKRSRRRPTNRRVAA